ncbi:MAG: RIP metalloprotease RseP [Pseudomonadota bacterium]
MDFLPNFGDLPLTIVAFIVALSIIVAVHEYGHYIVGRWTGIKADVFSLGFGPVLFSRFDRHGTKWQVAALPFGGYVKFKGDSDAASGQDAQAIASMGDTERRTTMHGAPLWARSLTVAAGPFFNFALSIAIFAGVILFSGQADDEPRIGAVRDLPADMALLQEGDLILAVEGTEVDSLGDVLAAAVELGANETVGYTIERAGSVLDVEASLPMVPIIDSVTPRSAAIEAGLEVGDVIQAVDGVPIYAFGEIRALVEASGGEEVALSVWRDGEVLEFALTPRMTDLPSADGGFESRLLIGITGGLFYEPPRQQVGAAEAAQYGVERTWFVITSSLSGLYHIIVGDIGTCNLQGPIGIAETSGAAASQGIDNFVWFVAILSAAVGLLNLFPIPVLDGGHLVFFAYEAAVGRPPSDRALRVFMSVGLTLLLSLMLFATFNDFVC